jgi:dTDP-4-dehydrorhamnose reductase
MQQLFQTKPKLTVIADQWGSPTSTQSLAHYVQELLKTPLPTGLFHCHDDGYTNWHEYTTFLAQELNYKNPIIPTESTHYPSPAKRPLNGKLSQNKLATHSTFTPIPWKESVQRYLKPQP